MSVILLLKLNNSDIDYPELPDSTGYRLSLTRLPPTSDANQKSQTVAYTSD